MSNQIENFAAAWLNLVKSQFKLFQLEAKLAKKSILPLLICIVAALMLVFSFWIVLLVLIGYLIYDCSGRVWLAILVDLVLSGALTALALYYAMKFSSRMQFKASLESFNFNRKKFHDKD